MRCRNFEVQASSTQFLQPTCICHHLNRHIGAGNLQQPLCDVQGNSIRPICPQGFPTLPCLHPSLIQHCCDMLLILQHRRADCSYELFCFRRWATPTKSFLHTCCWHSVATCNHSATPSGNSADPGAASFGAARIPAPPPLPKRVRHNRDCWRNHRCIRSDADVGSHSRVLPSMRAENACGLPCRR